MSGARGHRARRGVALLVAVLVLALVATLAVAAAFGVGQLHRGGDRLLAVARIETGADQALGLALAGWDAAARAAQPVGATSAEAVSLAGAAPPAAVVRVTRLAPTRFLLVADVRVRVGERTRRRVALVVRVDSAATTPRAVRGRAWAELF